MSTLSTGNVNKNLYFQILVTHLVSNETESIIVSKEAVIKYKCCSLYFSEKSVSDAGGVEECCPGKINLEYNQIKKLVVIFLVQILAC